MKGMELREFVCGPYLLAVEKIGRDWAEWKSGAKEIKEVKEVEEVGDRAGVEWMEESCGFGEDNMKECSTELARE